MAYRILAINGSYRRGGVIDQALEAACAAAAAEGAAAETVLLAEKNVEFCTNCRACTQRPGEKRGDCPLSDEMAALLDRAEAADCLILAAPVNAFNVTAVFRRFMERCTPYAYWPWGAKAPKMRLKPARRAALISSCAMPSLFGRLLTGAMRALKVTALSLGARPSATLFIGLSSMQEKPELSAWDRRLAAELGRKLAAGAR